MMDLPLGRIKIALYEKTDTGDVLILDCVWKQTLIGLHNDVHIGDNVALIHTTTPDGVHIRKVMAISSEYEYETLNRRILQVNLHDYLKPHGLILLEIGLLYESDGRLHVGERVISIQPNADTGEMHYVQEMH